MKDEWIDSKAGGYTFSEDYFSIYEGDSSNFGNVERFWNGDSKRNTSTTSSHGVNAKKSTVTTVRSSDEDELTLDLFDIQDELAHILLTKHSDYGSKNISDAPGGALNGIRVRMHDKIARLNNLIDNNKEPKHESIRDTLIDIANYATIAIMVIDDKWDK